MEHMSEHTGLISSYQLHTSAAFPNTGCKKAAASEQLTGAHLYLDKPGYLYHGYSSGMQHLYQSDGWELSNNRRCHIPCFQIP